MNNALLIGFNLRIVPHCNVIRIQLLGIIQKCFELDFLVAHHVRVWCAPSFVLVKEVLKNAIPVFLFEINRIIRNAYLTSHLSNILIVRGGRTNTIFISVIPVFHEDTDNIISLLLQQ